MSVKPLAGGVASHPLEVLTPSWRGSRTVRARSEMSSAATLLVMHAAKGLSDSDLAKSPIGLAQSHGGRSTNERTNRLGHLTLEKEIDHLSIETQ